MLPLQVLKPLKPLSQNILTILFSYAICDIQSADSQQVWTLPSGEHGVLCPALSIFSPGSPGSPPHILSVRQLPRLHINITFEPPEQKNGKMWVSLNHKMKQKCYLRRKITALTEILKCWQIYLSISNLIYLTMPNAETIVIFGTSRSWLPLPARSPLALGQHLSALIGPRVRACLCSLNPAFYDFLWSEWHNKSVQNKNNLHRNMRICRQA